MTDMEGSEWKPELSCWWSCSKQNYYQRNMFPNWGKGLDMQKSLRCMGTITEKWHSNLWVWKTQFRSTRKLTFRNHDSRYGWASGLSYCRRCHSMPVSSKAVFTHSWVDVVSQGSHICPPECLDKELHLLSKEQSWGSSSGLLMTYIYAYPLTETEWWNLIAHCIEV